jgi:hypothetical protein
MRLLTQPPPLLPYAAVSGGREWARANTGGLEEASSPTPAELAAAGVGGRGGQPPRPSAALPSPSLLAAAVPSLAVAPAAAAGAAEVLATGTGMGRGLMRARMAGSTTPPSSRTCAEGQWLSSKSQLVTWRL